MRLHFTWQILHFTVSDVHIPVKNTILGFMNMNGKNLLNANHLKLIAIIAMTVDHFCDIAYPGFPLVPQAVVMHLIGRLTAPVMWFFVCEGFFYTRNVKKYMFRLGMFAIISHFAYCFAFGIPLNPFTGSIFNRTSVIYPLFIAVVVLYMDNNEMPFNKWIKFVIQFFLIMTAFPADWSCIAVLAITGMYKNRGNVEKQMLSIIFWVLVYGTVSFFFVSRIYALILPGVLMVYPLLKMYDGQKGKAAWMKWFFYLYYPLHLVVIGMIRMNWMGDVPLIF